MTQEAVQITTTPPLPGLQLVQDMNKALETIATDFAGSTDPAAMAWAYSTWADTGTGTLKRRNTANSAWVIEGRLFRSHLPMYAQADVPALDIGPIYIIGQGPAEWVTSQYKVLVPDFPSIADLQLLGTPIGGYITPYTAPPTNDPRFRYVLCTAGEDGPGGYNEGILTGETVTGSAPLVVATATVSLAGSPFDGLTIHHINTEGRFVGAGEAEAFENDTIQGHAIQSYGRSGGGGILANVIITDGAASRSASTDLGSIVSDGINGTPRTSDHTQPRTHRLVHYRRIL